MAIEGAGGEEWRSLERGEEFYKPQRWQGTIDACRANIDSIRQRDVRLRLLDRAGRPVARRAVEVVQVDSDFLWGFCGWGLGRQIIEGTFDQPQNVRHRRWMSELFNAVNVMVYWDEHHAANAPMTEEHKGFPTYGHIDGVVDWALSRGLTPKCHPLFWPCPKAIPRWMADYDQATRLKFLEVRIRSLTARLRGRVKLYDAVNEMMWEPALKNTAQRHWPHLEDMDAIADDAQNVLQWARAEDPDARYTLNEYGVDHGDHEKIPIAANDGSRISRHEQLGRYIRLLEKLIQRGSPPDAVGLQTPHGSWGHHDRQVAAYDAIGNATGLGVHITEYRPSVQHLRKIGMPEDEIQARLCEYLENFLTCAFGHPHVEAFFFWGELGMFDERGPTKVYEHLRQLLRVRWRTQWSGPTNDQGVVQFRGFTGQYSLRWNRPSGQTSGQRFAVPAGGRPTELDLILPAP